MGVGVDHESSIIHSPLCREGLVWSSWMHVSRLCQICSWDLVSSLAIRIWFGGYFSWNQLRVFRIRWGDSKQAMGVEVCFFRRFSRAIGVLGRNPMKVTGGISNGAIESRVVRDDGPGMGTMLMSSPMSFFRNLAPGSETFGVPASETRAMFWPAWSCSLRRSARLDSLCLWTLIKRVLMS